MKTRYGILVVALLMAGCAFGGGGSAGRLDNQYVYPEVEPEWIRAGEPLLFEDEKWYPQDQVEVLRDAEVMKIGEYKDVAFFAERMDVRPFSRLYTKFGQHKFRVYRRRVAE